MTDSIMFSEAQQAPAVIATQWQNNQSLIEKLCQRLKKTPPPFAMTIARGSSDHAATFAKYLMETQLGLVTASAAPSVLTLYNRQLHLKNSLVIAISQSGQSPDICEMFDAARQAGAITVAFVNQVNSPLAKTAEFVIPLWAGEERAVAATKSYLASLAALIQLTAYYSDNQALLTSGQKLPQILTETLQQDTQEIAKALKTTNNLLVLGRGYGFAIAQEIALKFKETMSLHAEAFSSAEVLHGPFAVLKKNDRALIIAQADNTLASLASIIHRIKNIGAIPLLVLPRGQLSNEQLQTMSPHYLLLPASIHPICDPVMAAQALYPMIARLAISRGFNPDQPPQLQKVTATR